VKVTFKLEEVIFIWVPPGLILDLETGRAR
jgi:hypothetical protein